MADEARVKKAEDDVRIPDSEETEALSLASDQFDALEQSPESAAAPVPHSRGLIVLASLLGTVALALGVLSVYLWNTTDKWTAQVEAVVEDNYELGEQLAVERAQVEAQTEQIQLLTDQLATSNDQVLRLADEKASFDDDQALSAQQIAELTTMVATGAQVSNALNRCVDGQQQLAGYLLNADAYEPGELADFQTSLNQLCAAAEDANATFQRSLTE
jgi:hypothetical protein